LEHQAAHEVLSEYGGYLAEFQSTLKAYLTYPSEDLKHAAENVVLRLRKGLELGYSGDVIRQKREIVDPREKLEYLVSNRLTNYGMGNRITSVSAAIQLSERDDGWIEFADAINTTIEKIESYNKDPAAFLLSDFRY